MRHAIVACVGLALLWATPALAQTEEELAQARETFGEGVAHTRAERWPQAAEAFRAVLAVRDAPPVRYNLAFALSHLDAIDEAAVLLESVVDDPETDDDTRTQASAVLQELALRLGRLTVDVSGDDAGTTVALDGEPLAADRLGMPQWVLPGAHELTLRRGAETLDSERVSSEAGVASTVLLTAPLPAVAMEQPEPSPEGGDGAITEQWWFWTIIAAGVLAIGAGIVIGVVVADDGSVQPLSGDLDPGFLTVM